MKCRMWANHAPSQWSTVQRVHTRNSVRAPRSTGPMTHCRSDDMWPCSAPHVECRKRSQDLPAAFRSVPVSRPMAHSRTFPKYDREHDLYRRREPIAHCRSTARMQATPRTSNLAEFEPASEDWKNIKRAVLHCPPYPQLNRCSALNYISMASTSAEVIVAIAIGIPSLLVAILSLWLVYVDRHRRPNEDPEDQRQFPSNPSHTRW
jgi:hypothetical protein